MAEKGKRKLDRDQPFGTVFGSGMAAFAQHGILFDGAGNELPGYEHVKVPKAEAPKEMPNEKQVREMAAEIERLQGEVAQMEDARLDDAKTMAAKLEQVEAERDQAREQLAELAGKVPKEVQPTADGKKDKSKEAVGDKQSSLLDEQLKAQTGMPE